MDTGVKDLAYSQGAGIETCCGGGVIIGRYYGEVEFAEGIWVGLEMYALVDFERGHNGAIDGHR